MIVLLRLAGVLQSVAFGLTPGSVIKTKFMMGRVNLRRGFKSKHIDTHSKQLHQHQQYSKRSFSSMSL